ncbi:1-deoxy-D-xylulose-5-phosphate reductoisomerase [Pirellulaceae bacterium]|jgi:1-deoxy-D-xylulose-5-phosphate reductoisomerase|nr:1-deoxy-D-xylulose-5-phosphate reductoisomerase [Pirellulaceae bacterium]
MTDMKPQPKNVVVLGATGSIGCSTLEVIIGCSDRLRVVGLTGHTNVELLQQQAQQYRCSNVVVTDARRAELFDRSVLADGVALGVGPAAIESLVAREEVDVVVTGIVGSAGLRGTWAALQAGKTVALANKETLVMAGAPVMELSRDCNAPIIPVDSEHSAIFQALQSGRGEEVSRLILTASGGPFRDYSTEQLASVSVQDALAHPTWDMGPKITVDSATMMNKALEIIEARWLFDLPVEQIDVVVHPQSIVHSLVEFVDGSVLAQMGVADMKLPIQYALSYPNRWEGPAAKLDFTVPFNCEFFPPDYERFPALLLGREVAGRGGTCGAVLNAANEAAVARFLAGTLQFTEIVPACRAVLEHHDFDPTPSLDQLLTIDIWAREELECWKA